MNKVLVLGDGLLAKELVKQSGFDSISRKVDGFDITNPDTYYLMTDIFHGVAQAMMYDVVINAIGCTDTYSAEKQPHWNVNYKGVSDLVDFCNRWKVKLVHISTDYIYANSKSNALETDVPVHCNNWYGYTKLLGDAHVQLQCDKHLILRCTHKPRPFPYDKAWTDQLGNFDYVDIISGKILDFVEKDSIGIYNVGSDPKTIYELAKESRQDVLPAISKWAPEDIPSDITMNISKLKKKENE